MRNLLFTLCSLFLATSLVAQPPRVNKFGTSCGGTLLLVSDPKIGTTLQTHVLNDDANVGVVLTGFQKTRVPLGSSCYLWVMPVFFTPFASSGGVGTVDLFRIPNSRVFIGSRFVLQGIAFNSSGPGFTRGAECIVGT